MSMLRRSWNLFRELLGDALIVISGFLMLYIFIIIEIYGQYAHEPNTIIRWIEIALGPAIIVLGIDRFWSDLKRRKERRENKKLP